MIPHCPAPTQALPLIPIHPVSYQRILSKYIKSNMEPQINEKTWGNLMNEIKSFNKYKIELTPSDFTNNKSFKGYRFFEFEKVFDIEGKGKWVDKTMYNETEYLKYSTSLLCRLDNLYTDPYFIPLDKWKKKDLYNTASQLKIKNRSKMSKQELWRNIYKFTNNGEKLTLDNNPTYHWYQYN